MTLSSIKKKGREEFEKAFVGIGSCDEYITNSQAVMIEAFLDAQVEKAFEAGLKRAIYSILGNIKLTEEQIKTLKTELKIIPLNLGGERGSMGKKKTGLIIGRGRWKKELCEGDIIEVVKGGPIMTGKRFKIKYEKEWGAFMADEKGGLLLYLAQNQKWNDGTKLDVSKCKLIKPL